jgi:hypothetical protein
VKKSVATLIVTVDHILERLGARAGLDLDGLDLLHEANNLKTILGGFGHATPPRGELMKIVDRVARLDVRAKALYDARLGRLAERLPHSMRPTPVTQEQMREAIDGPRKITLTQCPACRGCTLCHDVRLVTPALAMEFELRNTPRRDRATMVPPKRPKGDT